MATRLTAAQLIAVQGAVSALQAALAAEDAAVYGYGVAGAHLTGTKLAAAEQDWTGHNQARDTLAAMISQLGGVPAAARAFYRLPFPVHGAAGAMTLAAYLEDGVTRAYLGIVAVSDRRLRDFGALAMRGPAARAAYWRGRTQAFPGLPLLAIAAMSISGTAGRRWMPLSCGWNAMPLARPDAARPASHTRTCSLPRPLGRPALSHGKSGISLITKPF